MLDIHVNGLTPITWDYCIFNLNILMNLSYLLSCEIFSLILFAFRLYKGNMFHIFPFICLMNYLAFAIVYYAESIPRSLFSTVITCISCYLSFYSSFSSHICQRVVSPVLSYKLNHAQQSILCFNGVYHFQSIYQRSISRHDIGWHGLGLCRQKGSDFIFVFRLLILVRCSFHELRKILRDFGWCILSRADIYQFIWYYIQVKRVLEMRC